MKKILLSSVALATITTLSMADSELSHLKKEMATMNKKIEALEAQKSSKGVVEVMPIQKGTLVKSKVPLLEFSGTHYLGFVNDTPNGGTATNKFETRRNYLQVKGYFAEDSKDYIRVTLDTHQDSTTGDWGLRLKYAYLYLDNILPYTGVEIGQVHRPWIDYEEHHGWFYRSISKVLVEDSNAADFTNSADIGINFKTKTDYFSSELGILNGAGYHGIEDGVGLSAEWRLTGHILGTGKSKEKSSTTYANISFFGQANQDYLKKGDAISKDFTWYGVHAVYNQPEFLISAQYIQATDGGASYKGDGFSVNAEYRFMEDWNALARYDSYSLDTGVDKKRTIAGIAYEYNKNVEFIVNYLKVENGAKPANDSDAIMFTACVEW